MILLLRSGTPSAMTAIVRMPGFSSASIVVGKALRWDEKLTTTSALGNLSVASLRLLTIGRRISFPPKKALWTPARDGFTIAATDGFSRPQAKSKSSIRCMAFCWYPYTIEVVSFVKSSAECMAPPIFAFFFGAVVFFFVAIYHLCLAPYALRLTPLILERQRHDLRHVRLRAVYLYGHA